MIEQCEQELLSSENKFVDGQFGKKEGMERVNVLI